MNRTATASWRGNLKQGDGRFSLGSGVVRDQRVTYRTRFENEPGTNPEELIAAAHATCFNMFLSGQLANQGITPDVIETTSTVTLENLTLVRSALATTVSAPGADRAKVEKAAAAAREGCPISKALRLEIILDLKIVT